MLRYFLHRGDLIFPTLRMSADLERQHYRILNRSVYPEHDMRAVAQYKKPGFFRSPRVLVWPHSGEAVMNLAKSHTPDVLKLPADTPLSAWYTVETFFDKIYDALCKGPNATWNEVTRPLGTD